MAERDVMVNGVTVRMYKPELGDKIRPMKASLDLHRIDQGKAVLAAIDALEEAGVKWLPLYESEAREAGIKWEETT